MGGATSGLVVPGVIRKQAKQAMKSKLVSQYRIFDHTVNPKIVLEESCF